MYIVKENGDGTVTIDKKIYEELHRKACETENVFVPMTPDVRESINISINE